MLHAASDGMMNGLIRIGQLYEARDHACSRQCAFTYGRSKSLKELNDHVVSR